MRTSFAVWLAVGAVVLTACGAPTGSGGSTPRSDGTPAPSPSESLPAAGRTASPTTGTPLPVPSINTGPQGRVSLQEFPVTPGSAPHDVAPAADGGVWYTGQGNGTLGHLDPATGKVREVRLGVGSSPHGVIVDRNGAAWVTDSGLNAILSVDPRAGDAVKRYPLPAGTPNVNLNTKGQGARRVWSDSKGNVWASHYNTGQVSRYDPAANTWKEWKLPGASPLAYSVYVDDQDKVWLTDFAAHAIVRFDPVTERFDSYPHARGGNVRQQLGRSGEVWGALSAHDKLLLVRTR